LPILRLFDNLHDNNRPLHEWVCIHRNAVIAYICFSRAYHGKEVCGLHLAPLAVQSQMQGQGIGSELLRFALRQEAIASQPIFVLGGPSFYQKFGFVPCNAPLCPFDKGNKNFLSIRCSTTEAFTIGYEPEFDVLGKNKKGKGDGAVKSRNPKSGASRKR
ncbi:MAG: GNAT family N-acetyltransferase, partial [Desulfobulbus sp.]|nr:GNAT family N-acetyltransferase [Desulfobulbus sp.]